MSHINFYGFKSLVQKQSRRKLLRFGNNICFQRIFRVYFIYKFVTDLKNKILSENPKFINIKI